jgi:hypothetical protein
MMEQQAGLQERLFYEFRLDDWVPADHLLRKIDGVLDLSGLRHQLGAFYSHTGRPSIDPELMVRMLLVGYCYGIRSERRLCEAIGSVFQRYPLLLQTRVSSAAVTRQIYWAMRRAFSVRAWSMWAYTSRTHACGQADAVTVRHASQAATASVRCAVSLSRSPSVNSALPRLFCVVAQSSGTRSRVRSSSATR